jgi:DNA-binding MarR family transcriptional regulator
VSDLTELGLNGYESAAYRVLLSRNGLSPSELAARAKVPRQRVYDVLDSLVARGLCVCRDGNPKTYFGVDPAVALEALSRQRAEELERERERTADKVRKLIEELAPVYQSGRGQNDPLAYVEVLADPGRIAARALALASAATRSVSSCIRRPLILNREQNWRFIREPLARGVRYRAVFERAALEDAELREWTATFRGWGQEIRLAPELPLKVQLFDDEVALLSMQDPVGGPPSFTALSVRHRGTVAFLAMAFERLWEASEPLGPAGPR